MVLRDGRRLAVPRPLAGRGLRHLRRVGRLPGVRGRRCPRPAHPRRGRCGDGPVRQRLGYVRLAYGKGGAALLAAREAAGAEAFDAALRCYVDANAWTIATPDDVAAALADLPAALDVLTEAGALDADDLPE